MTLVIITIHGSFLIHDLCMCAVCGAGTAPFRSTRVRLSFYLSWWGSCCQISCLHIFYVVCCIRVKRCSIRLDFHLFCREFMFFFCLFIFIYICWHPIRFPYQMIFVSFNDNTMGVTVEQELLAIPGHLSVSSFFVGFV
jgi:hypothetical protein